MAPLLWLGTLEVLAAGLMVWGLIALLLTALRTRRRRRAESLQAERLRSETEALKERLRYSLLEPSAWFVDPVRAGPIMGASAAFEDDIEAAARTVLLEAGGRRAKAKQLLRARASGNGSAAHPNGGGVAYWRQLGALSLLDDTPDAAAAYARAADLAPDDPQAQMLAGIMHLRAGKLSAAEAAFQRQIKLSSGEDMREQRYRAHTLLGDVHAARDAHEEAIDCYQQAQRELRALLEREPARRGLERDLSVTFDRIGDTLASRGALNEALESYRQALQIVEALSRGEPHNTVWLRDLSVSHDRIGDILDRKGEFEGALESYRRGLVFADTLASSDEDNTQWQWDLSVSHERIGDMLLATDRSEEALQSYHRGLLIAEALVARDPTNIGWRRDLAVSYHRIGLLEAARHNAAEARELLEKGRAIIARLERIASYQTQWRSDLAKFDRALEGLEG